MRTEHEIETMQAVVFRGVGDLRREEHEYPVCPGLILGHEAIGVIAESLVNCQSAGVLKVGILPGGVPDERAVTAMEKVLA